MIKLQYYIRNEKAKANGESPIYLEIAVGRKSVTVSTNKSISKERWDKTQR